MFFFLVGFAISITGSISTLAGHEMLNWTFAGLGVLFFFLIISWIIMIIEPKTANLAIQGISDIIKGK